MKQINPAFFSSLYILFFAIILSLSFSSFMFFRPFAYVDNNHSSVLCTTDGREYEINPNWIFAESKKLDPFNDAKARKLCHYQVIKDYNNIYAVPKEINYVFKPKLVYESSWLNAFFAAFLTFIAGILIIATSLSLVLGINAVRFKNNLVNFLLCVIN